MDGDYVLLSELQDAGLIENCGWFKKLIKKVVKIAVVAVTVVAVAATTAAVVVATAGAAAPALVAAGVGVTTSAGLGAAAGMAAGALFAMTVGQAAIQAGTAISEPIAEGVSQVVDKATGAIISIIAKGVEYVTIAVTSTLIYELEKNSYHLAIIGKEDNVVYISKLPIDRVLATWAMRIKMDIYTFYSENAYQVAKDAGDGIVPQWDAAHRYVPNTNILKSGIFFDHWHTASHMGHCMYGLPYINL